MRLASMKARRSCSYVICTNRSIKAITVSGAFSRFLHHCERVRQLRLFVDFGLFFFYQAT